MGFLGIFKHGHDVVEEVQPWYTKRGFLVVMESIPSRLPAREQMLWILGTSILAILILLIVQFRAFGRPPPVELKKLPKRPILQILFKPDDISNNNSNNDSQETAPASSGNTYSTPSTVNLTANESVNWRQRFRTSLGSFPNMFQRYPSAATLPHRNGTGAVFGDDEAVGMVYGEDEVDLSADHTSDASTSAEGSASIPETFLRGMDLPDSFAPLLSSSQTEVLLEKLTADLIHCVHFDGALKLRPGCHEIPLDKDSTRPQFRLDVPKGGCRFSVSATVGSDGFSKEQDLDVKRPTEQRSKPMVKNVGLILDPPLALGNVAPTLIHFPTLFDDDYVPVLKQIRIVRWIIDLLVSTSSFLERCLWIIESKCQIHLSKVRIQPLYCGHQSTKGRPEWRLSLAFSGHALLFGFIPIPFITVTLPSFIIPQPHALLEFLLSPQPLASATLKRENIAEERITLAVINSLEGWNANLKVVATPPVVGVDLTLPGGLTVAMEVGLGRDPTAGTRGEVGHTESASPQSEVQEEMSLNSLSSWTTRNEKSTLARKAIKQPAQFDANHLTPWLLELKAKGTCSREKVSVHVLKLAASHEEVVGGVAVQSQFATRGSVALWKVAATNDPSASVANASTAMKPLPFRRRSSFGRGHKRAPSFGHPELEAEDSPSVAAIFLFPDEVSFRHDRLLHYDYAFDVHDDTKIDAVTLSVGATHPMLNGGTMITTILDSIYAFGSITAREGAVLDPNERNQKRNVLRHLPAVDFTFGTQNVFIPPESESYSDDGMTVLLPELEGGRMMIRFLGGFDGDSVPDNTVHAVTEGVKIIADFGVGNLHFKTEGSVKEFPELDILDDQKVRAVLTAAIDGSIKAHLRPQQFTEPISSISKNMFNPLEAYEIDFSDTNLSVKMKEYNMSLGHRRVIFPTETTLMIKVCESVVDMGFEGTTLCELSWDFQGLSPILQVASLGESPENAAPENKQQASLLIAPLRQGRISFHVSPVGGIKIQKAVTSRQHKDGLYDWKFFNALVSPDEDSMTRIFDVLHDKATMNKLLQVTSLINEDLYNFVKYMLNQVWRAKEIFDSEGVSEPGHAIPMYKMARLIALFLTGEVGKVDEVMPLVQGVVTGEGLDVVKLKDLLRRYLIQYDRWAAELDRAARWAAVMLSPMAAAQPYLEDNVHPLAETPHHAPRFEGIPNANQLYQQIHDKPQLPLDPSFSNLVNRMAPYLSFRQIEYILQVRAATDWQPSDLRRIRYVYSIKRKVQDISESYGGLSFLPQSFLVSVFLGEATRSSLFAKRKKKRVRKDADKKIRVDPERRSSKNQATLTTLRRRRLGVNTANIGTNSSTEYKDFLSPAETTALKSTTSKSILHQNVPENFVVDFDSEPFDDVYELGDSLLGPQDVAILLQSGLTSVMKSSTVVQLNQRMLIDLVCSQPKSFAIAVLAEIGTNGGQGSPRSLTSALMALLELDQTAFNVNHKVDMHALLESWLPGLSVPKREDYMAGGRWARQSYYEALFSVAVSILDDAESYVALKGHVQNARRAIESDAIPGPRMDLDCDIGMDVEESSNDSGSSIYETQLKKAVEEARQAIDQADKAGDAILDDLLLDANITKSGDAYRNAVDLYRKAFLLCSQVLELDQYAFQSAWFRTFYKRNYDALMILSLYENVVNDVDNVRRWLQALRSGSQASASLRNQSLASKVNGKPIRDNAGSSDNDAIHTFLAGVSWESLSPTIDEGDRLFTNAEQHSEQLLIDAIIDAIIYERSDRDALRSDPLVRLLIDNDPGHYHFAIVSAMGVITEGKKGQELTNAFARLEKKRGVKVIRADTGTARSLEYNATKIIDAIEEVAQRLKRPYGLLGYSQGCANALHAETLLMSGSPQQQRMLSKGGGLVCRQLMFSAANGSFHGPAVEKKVDTLIMMCEDFFKYQQGFVSRAFASTVIETLTSVLDSAAFHKTMGGANSFLPDGCRSFWRDSQHLPHVPTCTLRGVEEAHTTPESLEMLSNLLTKQSGSPLHDSQVHVFDAVGYPVYHKNRNGHLLERCAIGDGAIQRTNHWSPLAEEVEFVRTPKDLERAVFDCAKDRHVFPWVEVNARFGFIKAVANEGTASALALDAHPSKLVTSMSEPPASP